MHNPAHTDSPVHDLVRARWSPRAFAAKPVPAGALRSMLESARWAASSYNEQPWRLIVATKDDAGEHERLLGCLVPLNQAWAKAAPVLMLMIMKHDFTHNGKPNRVAMYDCGAAAAQLTFEATHLGLVVHQMAGIDPDKCRETYKIPAGFEAIVALAVGYAGDPSTLSEDLRKAETAPRTRKPLKEVVFGGAFGSSWRGA